MSKDNEYRRFVRKYVTPNGWRSLGQVGWFHHPDTGETWDAFAVGTDEDGVKRPAWKLLAAQERGPQPAEVADGTV